MLLDRWIDVDSSDISAMAQTYTMEIRSTAVSLSVTLCNRIDSVSRGSTQKTHRSGGDNLIRYATVSASGYPFNFNSKGSTIEI
jgi:hypothetical protein